MEKRLTKEEFLKDLWHPYDKEDYKEGWRDFVCFYSVWKWAYQDDLLPKEGGEQ